MTMNTSSLFMSLQTISAHSLASRTLFQSGLGRIQMPATRQLDSSNHTTLSLRVRPSPSLDDNTFLLPGLI